MELFVVAEVEAYQNQASEQPRSEPLSKKRKQVGAWESTSDRVNVNLRET